jgi:hypothetical protein
MDFDEQIKNNKCTKEEIERITGEGISREEASEMNILSAIRCGRQFLSLDDMARILKNSFYPEELASICRTLLIKK